MGTRTVLLCACLAVASASLEVVNQWNFLQFDFPPDPVLLEKFQPENTVPSGLEIGWDRLYLGIPRLRAGVPATLAWVPRSLPPGVSPVLQAYPDWSWHTAGRGDINCTGLISVYRIRADRCNRLWVLDSGVITSLDDFRRVCPPKILLFDMATDRLVRSVYFPRELLRPASLLTNLVLDETRSAPRHHASSCDNIFAYITDTVAPGIIVYDARRDNAWRVTHASMYPDPDLGEYDIGGDKFTLMDGVVGIAHSAAQGLVYYQPLATDRVFSVSTAVLASGPPAEGTDLPVNLVGRKSSQGLGIAVDPRDDTIIFSPMTETAIAAWNPITNSHRVLAQDPEKLQFCAEVRWVARDNGAVWALSSRFHKYFKRSVSKHEINVRIVRVVEPGFGGGYVTVQPHVRRRAANFTPSLF
ncbi:dopaminechrome tautomerase-like [Maniola hyperantus]|uniref:dopaminechrome tautomerase-like n=1 Tax=Aphantopus hyperantus TaxID=2795564 RepID=UPI001568BD91|nr:protein yellow-like [Maniola hyperantus]